MDEYQKAVTELLLGDLLRKLNKKNVVQGWLLKRGEHCV